MGGWGGLIELVLILSIVIGWGVRELRKTKIDKREADEGKDGLDT